MQRSATGSTGVSGLHVIRYGTAADQGYIAGPYLRSFDQLVINANMVAHMRTALGSYICQKARRKPYFIDPQTHAFQHDLSYLQSNSAVAEAGQLKKSIVNLAKQYGDPIETILLNSKRSLKASDFTPNKIAKFCDRVLKFQRNSISDVASGSEAAKYYRFLVKKGLADSNAFLPTLLIAPYFFLENDNQHSWLDINISCAEESESIAKSLKLPLAVQLCLSKEILNSTEQVDNITNAYGRIKPDVFLVWLDEFVEQKEDESKLKNYIYFLRRLSKHSPVVVLYGGYFSILLSKLGIVQNLIGVAHGIEYGESRAVVPVGGGIPVAKYYLPAVHCRLDFRDALRAIRALNGFKDAKTFHSEICNCRVCRQIVSGDPENDFAAFGEQNESRTMRERREIVRQFSTIEARERSAKHYLWCKAKEYSSAVTRDAVIRQLLEAYARCTTGLQGSTIAHCQTWAKIISDIPT